MPIILEWTYEDGTTEIERIPVEIWRLNENEVSKAFVKSKPVKSVKLDPYKELLDINASNDTFGADVEPSRFQVFKSHKQEKPTNPMQDAMKEEKKKLRP